MIEIMFHLGHSEVEVLGVKMFSIGENIALKVRVEQDCVVDMNTSDWMSLFNTL